MEINDKDKLDMEDNGYRLNYQNNAGFLAGTSMPDFSWNAMPGLSCPNLAWGPNILSQFPKMGSFLPPSLNDIQADSGFIERAAKYSRFNGANVSAMLSSIGNPALDQGNRKENLVEGEEDVSSGGCSGEEDGTCSANAKKRKRPNQEPETNQGKRDQQSPNANNNTREILGKEEKGEERKPSDNNNHGKDGSDAGNKEEFVHVRARRGQATNSHSLAERVRREKISERMKYLQDLVPGCNKVTGKAVMLDEIINYVQSLQRQVEFLSMKLSAINPRLDFNIEGILSKTLFNPHVGAASAMGYLPDPGQIQLHHSHQNLLHASMASIVDSSDALRRIANPQLISNIGPKEPLPQMPNAWDGDYQNAMQVAYRDLNT